MRQVIYRVNDIGNKYLKKIIEKNIFINFIQILIKVLFNIIALNEYIEYY